MKFDDTYWDIEGVMGSLCAFGIEPEINLALPLTIKFKTHIQVSFIYM